MVIPETKDNALYCHVENIDGNYCEDCTTYTATQNVVEVQFYFFKKTFIPMGTEAVLVCRNNTKNNWVYNLCIWALRKYYRVEVIG